MIYADPGSGILIWQLLLALFFGVTFLFSRLRCWVVSKLRPNHHQHRQSLNTAKETYPAASISKAE